MVERASEQFEIEDSSLGEREEYKRYGAFRDGRGGEGRRGESGTQSIWLRYSIVGIRMAKPNSQPCPDPSEPTADSSCPQIK
jgi:hypothetical protein